MSILRLSGLPLFCLLFINALNVHAQGNGATRQIWKGKSGGFAIEWTAANLKAVRADNGLVIYDAAAEARKSWARYARDAKGAPLEAAFTYRLLSAVGPYLSVEEGIYCECGGAHPTAIKRFRAIDLQHFSHGSPSQADLAAVIPMPDVFAALISDPAVSKVLGSPAPKDLPALLDALQDDTVRVKDCDYRFPDDLLSNFAFYDSRDGNASVRLSLPPAAEVCRGQMTQLGLSVPVSGSLRASLAAAKEGREGLLMVDAARLANAIVTTLKFSRKGR